MAIVTNDRALTAQELFDHVARHLFEQGTQSYSADKRVCVYRERDHTMACAVGCLITEEEYRPEMDSLDDSTVNGLIDYELLPDRLVPHADLLLDLQGDHDTYDHWQSSTHLRAALRTTAEDHKLDPSILATLDFPGTT